MATATGIPIPLGVQSAITREIHRMKLTVTLVLDFIASRYRKFGTAVSDAGHGLMHTIINSQILFSI